MNRRLGTVAIILMALTALAGVLAYVFLSKKDPQNSVTQNQAVEDPASSSSSSSSKSAAPLPSAAPEGQSSVANLPDQPQGASTSAQKSSTNRVAQKAVPAASAPRRSIADILEGVDLSKPGERERVVNEMKKLESEKKALAVARAQELGLPIRVERPDGTVQEVVDVDSSGHPLYFTTHNVSAAISTGANVLNAAPYDLRGTNSLMLGVWDGGSARATHQEFGGRISVRDGSGSIDHATHVAGTMIAAGVVASAKGMAPVAPVASYDWNSDKTEMTAAGAVTATEAINSTNKFLISNHSYGFIAGWNYVAGGSPYRVWEWYGNGTTNTSVEADFGMYNTQARDSDSLAFSAPYFLMFRSAGNERNNNPSTNQSVALSPGSTTVVNYDPNLHPGGDGTYRGGFENISYDSVAKNVITVGSVLDAVTSGTRDSSKATPSSFTSFGPTDDGRVKPDVVANGEGVYSSLNSGDTSYGSYSGTSMSSPNAAGTAALLAQDYVRLFGQAMRASTLKGLLIHTADDRGNAGPDYQYGWGLINGKAASDLIRDHHANPLKIRLTENSMPTNGTTITHEFVWDGSSPIRVTMSWTDPAGTATTSSDFRSARLRNNLDLKIIAPDGTQHLPYTMPFVGTWTQSSISLPATTGINNTDNVEQVYVATPTASGVYRAVVSFQGTLANNQVYSLLVSGSANEAPPPPALKLEAVSPASANSGGVVNLELSGVSLAGVASVQLTKEGQGPIIASALSMSGEKLTCQVNLAGAGAGTWNVVATKGSETSSLTNAFTVIGTIYSENFDGTVSGWTSSAGAGATNWVITTVASHSPTKSYFAGGPSTKTTNALTSAAINIPTNASNLQLRFWHNYNFESGKDGGRLLISTNNGANWFNTDDTNSGVIFAANGYASTAIGGGKSSDRSIFDGKQAWTGNSAGFIETILNLTNTSKFAGKGIRFQWLLATDNNARSSTPSTGWYVDSIVLRADADLVNQPPSIISAATVAGAGTLTDTNNGITYHLVSAASATLQVNASDDGGNAALTYTWTATGPGQVFFLPNGTTNAASTTIDFEQLGDYQINVTVTDASGLSTTSTAYVRVEATPFAVRISPSSASLGVGGTQQFTAVLLDQFGNTMDSSAATFTWTATGGGTVSSSGLFTATQAGENFSVVAGTTLPNGNVFGALSAYGVSQSSNTSDFAQVTVTPGSATVSLGDLTQTYNGSPRPVTVTTDPPGLAVSVTYNGSSSSVPSEPGLYPVVAEVTDPNYQGGTSATLTITGLDDPQGDTNGDGIPNLVEYALATNSSGSILPILLPPTNGVLTLTAIVRTNDPGLGYTAHGVTNLMDYADTNLVTQIEGTANGIDTNNVPAGFQRQEFRFTNNAPRAFLKLTIQQQ